MIETVLRRRTEWFLIGLGVVFYLFLFPHSIGGDGSSRFEALLALLNKGEIRPMLYSYVHPLVSAPLYYLGELVKTPFWWVSRFNTFVFLLTAWALWRFFRREWSAPQSRLFLLLLFCASMFPKHITDFYSEVFCACLAALAIACFIGRRFWPGALLLCLSVWNSPGSLLAGAGILFFFSWRERRWRYAAALFPMVAGLFLENFLKYGTIFPDAYLSALGHKGFLPYSEGPGFSYPLFFGLLSVFFSYGKGLLFYTPGLLSLFFPEVFRGRAGEFLRAGLFYLAGLVLVYARWWAWHGDFFWGPRFYLFASLWAPVALAALWPYIWENKPRLFFWVAVTALSLWVGCQGVLYGQDFLEACNNPDVNLGFMCHYVPEYSPLWRPFVVWPIPFGRKIAYLTYFLIVFGWVLSGPGVRAGQIIYHWAKMELRRLLNLREWKL